MSSEHSATRKSSEGLEHAAYWFLAAFVVIGLVAAYLIGVAGARGPGVLSPESADLVAAVAIAVLAVALVYLLVTYRESTKRLETQSSLLYALEARIGESAARSDAQAQTLRSHAERLDQGKERTEAVVNDLEAVRSASNANARLLDDETEARVRAVEALDRRQSMFGDTLSDHSQLIGTIASRLAVVEERTVHVQDDVARNADGVETLGVRFDEHAEAERRVLNEAMTSLGLLQDEVIAVDSRQKRAEEEAGAGLRRTEGWIGALDGRLDEIGRRMEDQRETLEGVGSSLKDVREGEVHRAAALESVSSRTDAMESQVDELSRRFGELEGSVATQADRTHEENEADHADLASRLDQVIRRVEEMDQLLRRQSAEREIVGGMVERIGGLEASVTDLRKVEAERSERLASLERRLDEREAALPVTIADLLASGKTGGAQGPRHGGRPVKDVEGIGDVYSRRLHRIGVRTIDDLRAAEVQDVVTGIAVRRGLVEEWKDMAELMRVPGIGPQFSELLVKSGIRTIEDLATIDPAQAYARIQATVEGRDMPLNRARVGVDTVRRWAEAAIAHLQSGDALRSEMAVSR